VDSLVIQGILWFRQIELFCIEIATDVSAKTAFLELFIPASCLFVGL
jgi:hypothetical protein